MEYSLDELMPMLQAGDPLAFEVIYEKLKPVLTRFLFCRVDSGEIDDLVQEAMVRVWKGSQGFDVSRGSVTSWAIRIVANLVIDFHRRQERKSRIVGATRIPLEGVADTMSGTNRIEKIYEAMDAEINQLPVDLQIVCRGSLAGDSMSVCADNLGYDGPMKARKRRAAQMLKAAMRRLRMSTTLRELMEA